MLEKITKWYKQNLWTTAMVQMAAQKGIITEEQMNDILSQKED